MISSIGKKFLISFLPSFHLSKISTAIENPTVYYIGQKLVFVGQILKDFSFEA